MLYMFQAGFPPIIRSLNCTHSVWYMSSLLAATASGSSIDSNKECCIMLHLVGCTGRNTLTMHGAMKVKQRYAYLPPDPLNKQPLIS